MKLLLFLAAAISIPSPAAEKITAENVIAGYVKAIGGATTGKSGAYSLVLKSPDRFYSEIVVQPEHGIRAYNGMSGWQDSSAGARTLTGQEEQDAGGRGLLWNSRLAGAKQDKLAVRLKGTETLRDRPAYHLQVKLAPGAVRDVYIDAQTHAEDQRDISKTLRAERFTNPRPERLHGQTGLAFDFNANPDYRPKAVEQPLARSVAGVLRTNEQAHEAVRLEAHFVSGFKLAGGLLASLAKSSNMVFEQIKVNERFSNYKNFTAESRIVAVNG